MLESPTATVSRAAASGDRLSAAGWRIVLLASLGGALEFYDFVIFGVFARDIGEQVFPASSPLASLMASFAAFAAGYLVRPFGGLVLGHYGDRVGRRRIFLLSLFVMSVATVAMGLVPGYAAWGAAASVLMVALRLIQGFCLGGELPGALTYVVETAPRIAPFVCGVVFAFVTMGVALATGVSLTVRTLLPAGLVPFYGWRVAFVLGGLGGIVSFVLRRSLEESPEFARMRGLALRQPFREVLRTRPLPVVLGVALVAGTACFNGLFFSHLPAYLSGVLNYDPRQAVLSQTVGVTAAAVGILATGWLGDRIAPRHLLRLGVVLLALLAYPFYTAVETRALDLSLLLTLAGLVAGLTNGAFAALLTDLFPTAVRFTGVALVFNISFTLFSGTAPLVATSLIDRLGSTRAPALLMAACGLLAAVASGGIQRFGGHVLSRNRFSG